MSLTQIREWCSLRITYYYYDDVHKMTVKMLKPENCSVCIVPILVYVLHEQYLKTVVFLQLISEVESGVSYLYWVEAVSGSSSSQPSPVLNYTHGQAFCGDGNVDRSVTSTSPPLCAKGFIFCLSTCDTTVSSVKHGNSATRLSRLMNERE